ncbi:MAG TPA: hypothetical protein VG126_06390 [Thermoleophilaceae bacterium]|nr:hypothetical protein [Thermoleophilaceae bacterium]
MASRKLMIGRGAALAGLFARVRRRPEPAPPPAASEPDDEPGDEVPAEEVLELREELRAELERLSGQTADIKASRTSREGASPPG